MPRPRRRRNRFSDQAALEALLRFGPELSGLRELQLAAQQQFTTGVRQATAGRRAIGQAITAAQPDVRAIYNRAGDRVENTNAVLGSSMEGAPASLQAALAQEQSGFSNRLEESRADALTDLKGRRVAAREGEHTAIRAARDEFANTLAQVMRRNLDLQRERGAFTAMRSGELRQAAQERADQFALKEMDLTQSERNSLRSAGIDPSTGKPIPGGPLTDGGGRAGGRGGRATNEKHLEWETTIEQIANTAKRYRGKMSRAEIVEKLKAGRPQQTIRVDPETGEPLPNPATLPAIPQFDADLRMTAALDMALDGHLSRATQRKLHRAGFSVKRLNLTSYGDWRQGIMNSGAGQHPRT